MTRLWTFIWFPSYRWFLFFFFGIVMYLKVWWMDIYSKEVELLWFGGSMERLRGRSNLECPTAKGAGWFEIGVFFEISFMGFPLTYLASYACIHVSMEWIYTHIKCKQSFIYWAVIPIASFTRSVNSYRISHVLTPPNQKQIPFLNLKRPSAWPPRT